MAGYGEQPVMIKKVKKVIGGGHHGGAWKVAYADFVTAMMAFFLLMWLINTTSPEQKRGIADYFAPAAVSASTSGSGGVLAGTAMGDKGVKSELAAAKKENEDFQSAAESLRQALQDMPELAELSKQVLVDVTPEGLRIQLVDQEGRSMFDQGTARPNDRARLLLRSISKVINQLHNRITVAGHTSATPPGQSSTGDDWALSASRANASRAILQGAGVPADRIYQVSGKASSEPLFPDDPTLPGNRRIAIVLLREAPVLPPNQPQ